MLHALGGRTENGESVLSPRELQVLELMALGKAKKEVADELDVSYHAIALYTRNIYKKLEAPNITAAVATAIRRRLI
jgi:DNA-binding NarL/FixJ family response regulator